MGESRRIAHRRLGALRRQAVDVRIADHQRRAATERRRAPGPPLPLGFSAGTSSRGEHEIESVARGRNGRARRSAEPTELFVSTARSIAPLPRVERFAGVRLDRAVHHAFALEADHDLPQLGRRGLGRARPRDPATRELTDARVFGRLGAGCALGAVRSMMVGGCREIDARMDERVVQIEDDDRRGTAQGSRVAPNQWLAQYAGRQAGDVTPRFARRRGRTGRSPI